MGKTSLARDADNDFFFSGGSIRGMPSDRKFFEVRACHWEFQT